MELDDRRRCEHDCARLCLDFAHTVDTADHDAFIALFAADGVFERGAQLSRGAEAIRQFLDARPVDRTTRHLCTDVRIDMTSPTTAVGTCCTLMVQALAAKNAPLPLQVSGTVVVDYADDYVLTEDGWKFRHRRTTVVLQS